MHILGLANGTPNGNSEILLKAALHAAREQDPSLTTSWIHIPSVVVPPNPPALPGALDISHGKNASMRVTEASKASVGPDDRAAVLNAILDADALVFSTPVYSRQPAGTLKAVIDRILGPYTDCSFAFRAKERQEAGDERFQNIQIDERLFKPRVAAFICAAGSIETNQTTMALPTLHTLVFSIHAKVVDQAICYGVPIPGLAAFKENGKAVTRAQELGRNVASEIGKTFEQARYLGPSSRGACTYCHLCKIEILESAGNEPNAVECTTCGAQGKLTIAEDGVFEPVWNANCAVSSITMAGKMRHLDVVENGSKRAPMVLGHPDFKTKCERWTSIRIPKVELPSAKEWPSQPAQVKTDIVSLPRSKDTAFELPGVAAVVQPKSQSPKGLVTATTVVKSVPSKEAKTIGGSKPRKMWLSRLASVVRV